jgi:biopolymer transport protein ExbD
MRFASERRRRDAVHVDLTAMIDVVFQLVLFLILTTTFEQEAERQQHPSGPAIDIRLPQSQGPAVSADTRDIQVWIGRDGTLYLNDEPTDRAALEARFAAAAAQDTSALVVIRADQGVAHGSVVAVMDLARRQGLSRLAIATEDPEVGSQP